MIGKCLDALKSGMYSYIARLPELNVTSEAVIYLTPVIKYDGSIAIPDNSLALTLVNVEEERVMKSQTAVSFAPNGQVSHQNPEIKLNLYILISANFSTYSTGLEYLSGAIRFFQSKGVFTRQNTPGLHSSIEKLIVELHSLSFEQQNHLWGSLGAKYLPSVMYKVRLITIQEGQKADEAPPLGRFNIAAMDLRS
ncbi:MAG: DUF4255 domain-containing protein [Thermodesulfovibrionales bacterium]|jgi:hypothetical protein